MLSSSATSPFTNRIRNSMGQTPCHGMSAPPAVVALICYPCCRYILLPMLPVRTFLTYSPASGETRVRAQAVETVFQQPAKVTVNAFASASVILTNGSADVSECSPHYWISVGGAIAPSEGAAGSPPPPSVVFETKHPVRLMFGPDFDTPVKYTLAKPKTLTPLQLPPHGDMSATGSVTKRGSPVGMGGVGFCPLQIEFGSGAFFMA